MTRHVEFFITGRYSIKENLFSQDVQVTLNNELIKGSNYQSF